MIHSAARCLHYKCMDINVLLPKPTYKREYLLFFEAGNMVKCKSGTKIPDTPEMPKSGVQELCRNSFAEKRVDFCFIECKTLSIKHQEADSGSY